MSDSFTIKGTTKILAVGGWPVKHSLSPPMHNAAIQKAGLDYAYIALPIHPDQVTQAVKALPALGIKGLNLTLPHKKTCLPALNKLDESVDGIGAVNTIKVEEDGTLTGHNTDAYGFVKAFEEEFNISVKGKKYFQVGAGGAGTAMAIGMARAGVEKIVICNRTVTNAEKLAEQIRHVVSGSDVSVVESGSTGAINAAQESDLLANATSLGMQTDDPSPLAAEAFREGQFVYDSIYVRTDLPFGAAAQSAGAQTAIGTGMLVHQGARALEIWTGIQPDTKLMRQVIDQHLGLPN
jgi:shikimate dehydrogenase